MGKCQFVCIVTPAGVETVPYLISSGYENSILDSKLPKFFYRVIAFLCFGNFVLDKLVVASELPFVWNEVQRPRHVAFEDASAFAVVVWTVINYFCVVTLSSQVMHKSIALENGAEVMNAVDGDNFKVHKKNSNV